MPDRYGSWAALARAHRAAVDYAIRVADRGSAWLIAAPHGGAIERGTTEIAQGVAGDELSLYSVVGLMARGNEALHLTSHRFDEPTFLRLAARHERVLAIHGCDEGQRAAGVALWVGGGDEALVARAIRRLNEAGYPAAADGYTPGRDRRNLCNQGTRGGLQLELTASLRARFFRDLTRAGRQQPTEALAPFVATVRSLLDGAP